MKNKTAQNTLYIPRHTNNIELIFWPAIILLLANTANISNDLPQQESCAIAKMTARCALYK